MGGEPSLLRDFEEIVRCIRTLGLDLIVQSNGSLRPDQLAVLKEVEVRYVSVSLDSPLAATNDRLRFDGAAALAHVCIRRCVENHLPAYSESARRMPCADATALRPKRVQHTADSF